MALAAAEYAGVTLTLTGSQALSLEEIGAAVGEATHRELPVTTLDADAFTELERLLGRPPRTVGDVAEESAAVPR